jgi:hypothetical protein
MKISNSPKFRDTHIRDTMSLSQIKSLCVVWLWLAASALAQRDCEKDGDTSTYNQNSLVVPFKNLCGRDIEAFLDYLSSSEPRRSDCIDRCVKQAPLCYGFDYTPYTSNSQNNCYLMNGTLKASNSTYRNFVADAGMLDSNLATKLPKSCQSLSLRECLEKNAQLLPSASATSTSSSSTSISTASTTSAPTADSTNSGQTAAGTVRLSTSAKAGIDAGIGLVALIVVLTGVLLLLRRVKRRRRAAQAPVLITEAELDSYSKPYPQHKAESQAYAHMETSSLAIAAPRPVGPASSIEQLYEMDGRARREK